MTTTLTIKPSYDTFAREDASTTNYRSETYLRMRTDTNVRRWSYLFFPITIPQSATVISATLTLTAYSAAWAADGLTAERVTETWREGTLSWTDKPAVTTANAATADQTVSAGGTISLTVTDIVQDWVSGAPKYGFRLSTDATTLRSVYSSEALASRVPVLTVEYMEPAEVPTNLRPDNGAAESLAKPVLVWDGSTPTQIKIQIDEADTFAVPHWDSDWTAWTQTSYDTAADGSPPADLTNNTTYYWRVATKDANGVESGWSETAEFQYRTHGTLTITAPAADNDDVATTTPAITHTFVNRTQAEAEYVLERDNVVVYTRSREPQTATSFEIPAGYVKSQASDYDITVRIWDDLTRSAVGALPYVEATRRFQFTADGTPDPVTALTAVTEDGHVHIEWVSAAEPDYFAVEVEGLIHPDHINASDVLVSGTDYAYDSYRVVPQTSSQTIKVHRVVVSGGVYKYPNDSPSADVNFAPIGVWLVDETAGTEVFIGDAAVATDIGESGATFFPLSRQDPVRIVDIVRGFEGSVTGRIITLDTVTAATYRGAFEDMKENLDHDFRLIYGYRNIPIVVGESSLELISGEESYLVAFDFWQSGEFTVAQ